jgi:hypothetical protein
MDTNNKELRVSGGIAIFLAMLYYAYQIYTYLSNWYSLSDIQNDTSCDEIFTLELWLLSQDIIWLLSLSLLLTVLIDPELYKLLLCFLYLMGPVYLMWTLVAIGYYSWFVTCCNKVEDNCTDFYPYQAPLGFITLLVVSLVFSSLITFYLLSILVQALWGYFRSRFQQYTSFFAD